MGKEFALAVSVAAVLSGGLFGGAAPAWADPVTGQSCSDVGLVFGSLAGPLVCSGDGSKWSPEPQLQTMALQLMGDRCTSMDGTTANAADADGNIYLSMCYQGVWTHYRP